MKTIDMFGLALGRLKTSRLRTLLTMLGVIIGVASVVALVAIGQGSTSTVEDRLSSLGTNLVTISADTSVDADATLSVSDALVLAELDSVAGVSPEDTSSEFVTNGDTTTTTTITGTNEDYLTVRTYELWQGSELTELSVDNELRLAVVGSTTADDLGLTAESVGEEIEIGGLPFVVAGILQEKGGTGFPDPDDQVLIPITTLQKYFTGNDDLRTIAVSATSAAGTEQATEEVSAVLRELHELSATGTEDDFSIVDQAQLLETASEVNDTMTLMLAGIASISLIVGGIGIMNIMLVSVRERTREIGIRKSIGAKGRDIMSQFLVESVVLSLVGGLIGVVVGVAATYLVSELAGWGVALDLTTIAIAVGFSVAIGVVFGVWPARQAAKLDPIQALHYE